MSRVINALIEELNKKDTRLPKYLVVVLDKDIIYEVDSDMDQAHNILGHITFWLVNQINLILWRKCTALMDKKPGMVSRPTTIMFVWMLRRISTFLPESNLVKTYVLRAKFNDALNNAATKIQATILTITSCNTYRDFNRCGNPSNIGKQAFWYEIDEVFEKLDRNKFKLLPNPKNPPKYGQHPVGHHHYNNWHSQHGRRKMPMPPPSSYHRY